MEQKGVPGMVALSETAYRSMPPGSLCDYEVQELPPVPFGNGMINRWTLALLSNKGKNNNETGSGGSGGAGAAAGEIKGGGAAKRNSLVGKRLSGGLAGSGTPHGASSTRTTAAGAPTHVASPSQVPSQIYMPSDNTAAPSTDRSTPPKGAAAAAEGAPTVPAGGRPTAIRVFSTEEQEQKPGSPDPEDAVLPEGDVLIPGLYQEDAAATDATSPAGAASSVTPVPAHLESYLKAQHAKNASKSATAGSMLLNSHHGNGAASPAAPSQVTRATIIRQETASPVPQSPVAYLPE